MIRIDLIDLIIIIAIAYFLAGRLWKKLGVFDGSYSPDQRKLNETIKIKEASDAYWDNFNEWLGILIGKLSEIYLNNFPENQEANRLLLVLHEEKKWDFLVHGEGWSENYQALMAILQCKLPQIFSRIEKLSQAFVSAYSEGYMKDGEFLYICQKRRADALREIERQFAFLAKEVS